MSFVTCPNCLAGYGAVQGECPTCGADVHGDGARVEFDRATRTAIQRLGGIFGGLLETPEGLLVWCSRGVCLVREEVGLAWHARTVGQVEDVRVGAEEVLLTVGGRRAELDLVDGSERAPR